MGHLPEPPLRLSSAPPPPLWVLGLNGSQLQPGDHPQWKRTTSPKVMSPLPQGQPISNHGSVSRNRDLTCFPEGNNSECPTQPKVPMGSAEVFVNVTEPNLGPVAHEHESQSIDAGLQWRKVQHLVLVSKEGLWDTSAEKAQTSRWVSRKHFFFFIRVYFIYNVVLVSAVEQSESVIHIHVSTLFLRFFSHIGHYRVLSSLCY